MHRYIDISRSKIDLYKYKYIYTATETKRDLDRHYIISGFGLKTTGNIKFSIII